MNQREIQFRAWHKRTKVMIDWRMLSLLLNGTPIAVTEGLTEMLNRTAGFPNKQVLSESFHSCNIFELKGIDLMQYTGLKDKNGKEIYEGDVVLTGWEGFINKEWYVGWGQGGFVLINNMGRPFSLNSDDFVDEDGEVTKFEVIGNIYESPELLK